MQEYPKMMSVGAKSNKIRVAACSPQIRPRYWGSRRQTHHLEHPHGNELMLRDLRPPIVYWGYIGIVENKMETTIANWG